MAINLLSVFKNVDLLKVGKSTANIISVAFKADKSNGSKIARAVLDNGITLIKTITSTGVISQTVHHLPEILSKAQRNDVIKDLCKQGINQETIAAMLDISQSTVSNVLRKKRT